MPPKVVAVAAAEAHTLALTGADSHSLVATSLDFSSRFPGI
jgi:hypothetical protein